MELLCQLPGALGLVQVLCYFCPCLFKHRFLLCVDHASLTWLLSFNGPQGQLAQCMEALQDYNTTAIGISAMLMPSPAVPVMPPSVATVPARGAEPGARGSSAPSAGSRQRPPNLGPAAVSGVLLKTLTWSYTLTSVHCGNGIHFQVLMTGRFSISRGRGLKDQHAFRMPDFQGPGGGWTQGRCCLVHCGRRKMKSSELASGSSSLGIELGKSEAKDF
ncbi:uncharacterized protein LOC132391739 [Hypanus sabinus]|uniref:uncharacterized protein LOC132391739 n=1 Tax=Hypanus sabinus TaxID=79690 RepID=UPI0028C41E5E|nr:uncharacterized protein LOC132391739 [Hypanus sabinus]